MHAHILALRRYRQGDQEFKVSLGCIPRRRYGAYLKYFQILHLKKKFQTDDNQKIKIIQSKQTENRVRARKMTQKIGISVVQV